MSIVLYPRVAPKNCLRVWIGAFHRTQAPALVWSLNDNQVNPSALREISSARTNEMLSAGESPDNIRRAFTGVYEFRDLQVDTPYRINVQADGASVTLETRTLPPNVPTQINQSFNVLLASCFHAEEDRGGLAGTVVSQLKASYKPHMTILAGDQVYLDLPTLKDFPDDDLPWLARKFEEDYVQNWYGELAYAKLLAAAPSISSPDDHEYWNNYPHPSPFIGNSRTVGGRERWKQAAQAMYQAFQLPYPAKLGDAETFDIHPLSFFFADTRSEKDPKRAYTMSENGRRNLTKWVARVITDKLFPVFVSGQSLFCKPAGRFGGAVGDYELANYGDYGEIVTSLKKFAEKGIPLLCLTGDVHWGRVATTTNSLTGRTAFTEVISSPASLVATVGADQAKLAIAGLAGIFGSKNPWPRHSDPAVLPTFFAQDVLNKDFPCSWIHGQRGNHVVILSFRQYAGGIELRIKYWPIHKEAQFRSPVELKPINLVRA